LAPKWAWPGVRDPISKFWDPPQYFANGKSYDLQIWHARAGSYCGGHLAAQLVHYNMIESAEQKEQQKSTQKRKKKITTMEQVTQIYITFSHDRYFATSCLLLKQFHKKAIHNKI